ncbi:MAG: energy transducer TonB [Novosphingobium sp.]|nr:energy transducer TonB [Novosphingobium sp.]
MLILVLVLHLLAIVGLVRAFAPDFAVRAIDRMAAVLTVTVSTREVPPAAPSPDRGAAAPPGKKAKPRAVSAPERTLPVKPTPLPPVSGAGALDRAGAAQQGAGTGAGGEGPGTGSGNGGSGQGSGGARRLEKVAGEINSARDYPVPPGGRQARFGTSVTIALTVGTDGRPSACRIVSPSPFPDTDATTCRLAMERFRFRPATDRDGSPIVATYGWRQEFREAR